MSIKPILVIFLFAIAGAVIATIAAKTIICLKEQSDCSNGYHYHAKDKPCWEFPRDLFRTGSWD